jgi:hypothetical protein
MAAIFVSVEYNDNRCFLNDVHLLCSPST